jgi:hypothetical protein
VIRGNSWVLIADPDIELSRDNMFIEEYIGPIKAAKLVNFRLYNIRTDPAQQNDISGEHPDVYRAMKQAMISLHGDVMAEAYDWRRQ